MPDKDFACAEDEILFLTSQLTMVGGKIVYGAGDFKALDENDVPPDMPDWSPVRRFGGFAAWGEPQGAGLNSLRRTAISTCGCANSCKVHGHDHAGAWTAKLPIADLKGLARGDVPFVSIDDMWRRAGVSSASLVKLAEADAFRPSLKLERRDALWAIKALRDEPLPLFAAAADRERAVIAEQQEPDVALRQMTEGANVVEDYGHTGVTLRAHPVSFLRGDLARRNIVTCAEATSARDGRWLMTAGLVLVRQKPGSAKGVMLMTIEDETGVANIVVWPSLFERQRRVVLGSAMMAINGKIQREGGVVQLVAQRLFALTSDLASLGERDTFRLPSGRGDEFAHDSPGSPDSCERPPMGVKAREIYVPDLHIDTLKVKSRNFQ